MLACVVGYYTSVSIERRSIYAEPLKRKGAGDYRHQLAELHVRDLVKTDPLTVPGTARFAEIAQKFIATRVNYLYVTDGGRFVGAISLHDIKNYLNAPELAELVIADDIVHHGFPVVRPEATLAEAMESFVHHDGERLPVVSNVRRSPPHREHLENRCDPRARRQQQIAGDGPIGRISIKPGLLIHKDLDQAVVLIEGPLRAHFLLHHQRRGKENHFRVIVILAEIDVDPFHPALG